jgi:hypothetical protein
MATKRLFVVYQMGKVASVAIAETLAAIDGAEVEHCHYLSRAVIEASLTKALNPELSEETYWHTSRQVLKNLDVHRRIRQIESGVERDVDLCLITLAREPLAWTRSNLVQNLFEHEAVFRRICQSPRSSMGTPCASAKRKASPSTSAAIGWGGRSPGRWTTSAGCVRREAPSSRWRSARQGRSGSA